MCIVPRVSDVQAYSFAIFFFFFLRGGGGGCDCDGLASMSFENNRYNYSAV